MGTSRRHIHMLGQTKEYWILVEVKQSHLRICWIGRRSRRPCLEGPGNGPRERVPNLRCVCNESLFESSDKYDASPGFSANSAQSTAFDFEAPERVKEVSLFCQAISDNGPKPFVSESDTSICVQKFSRSFESLATVTWWSRTTTCWIFSSKSSHAVLRDVGSSSWLWSQATRSFMRLTMYNGLVRVHRSRA